MTRAKDAVLITLNIPPKLLDEFDEAIKGHYKNRSEAIRDAMRKLLQELER